jgi:L-seryl-tRNA(Ser) seleniumtransferase
MGDGDRRLAELPAVHRLVAVVRPELPAGIEERLTESARAILDDERARLRADPSAVARDEEALADALRAAVASARRPGYRRVLNATGVVLHTNLGRAPLSGPARRAVAAAAGYCALEMDLDSGRRSERDRPVVDLLVRLCGCEDALVVNNNAAATLLVLAGVAGGRGAVLSRGELVEIGGSFRMPEIMAASGVRLIEVGTTNRTHLADYEAGLAEADAALLLRVHRSNFHVQGFTRQVPLARMVTVADTAGVPLLYDLGSGLMGGGDPGEPGLREALHAGVDLVCFSGDKLLGGPQAGIVVGRREWVQSLRRHPLKRALRCDKLTLAALDATLRLRLGLVEGESPVERALAAPPGALRARARSLKKRLQEGVPDLERWVTLGLRSVSGRVGGGSEPERRVASAAVTLTPKEGAPGCDAWSEALRRGDPPVVARVKDGAVELHPLTLLRGDRADLLRAVAKALGRIAPGEPSGSGGDGSPQG